MGKISVTRCKQCRYADHYENTAGSVYCMHKHSQFLYGQNMNMIYSPVMRKDDYCSYRGMEPKPSEQG